jgi:uncharacterized protein YbaP (TraB family)
MYCREAGFATPCEGNPIMRSWFASLLSAILLLTAPAFAEGQGPALWKISGVGTTIYLFGSVHVLKPGTPWIDDKLRQKISSATAIYLEVPPREQQPLFLAGLFTRYGILAKGDSLKNHLPSQVYAEVGAAFRAHGMPEKAYDSLKPWSAEVTYSSLKFLDAGYKPEIGVEATITALAQAKGIETQGLETAELQVALLASLTDQEAVQMLQEDLAEDTQMQAVMDRLTRSWSSGDVTDLDAYFDELTADDPRLRKMIITDRNAAWVPKIQAIMGKPGTYFVVVGTGHLVGPQSLIAMLRGAGLQVERVN